MIWLAYPIHQAKNLTFKKFIDPMKSIWALKSIKRIDNRAICISEKASIRYKDIIPTPHISHRAFAKHKEGCALMQIDACSDHPTSAAIFIFFLDVGRQFADPFFFPGENTT